MAINFPLNPTAGDIYTVNGRSWQWDGSAWGSYGTFADPASFKVDTVNDRVGVNLGSATPSYTLDVSGDARVSSDFIVGGDLTVSGTTVTLDSQNLLVEDNIITLNSNVTGTPSLDAGIEVERGDETNAQVLWDESAGAWVINSDFTVDTSTLHVDSTNKRVGIGTTTPSSALDIVGDINVTAGAGAASSRIDLIGGDARVFLEAESSIDGDLARLWAYDNVTENFIPISVGASSVEMNNVTVYSGLTVPTGDFTVDTDTLHVDSTNNRVGIGTTTPQSSLGVDGDIDMVGTARSIVYGRQSEDGPFGLEIVPGSSLESAFYYRTDPDKWSFENSTGTNVLAVDIPNERVGIGTSTPSELLDVDAGTSGSVSLTTSGGRTIQLTANDSDPFLSVGSTTAHSASIMTNGIRRIIVLDDGKVGIGTSEPGYLLDVRGDAQVAHSGNADLWVKTTANSGEESRITIGGARTGSDSDNLAQLRFWNYANQSTNGDYEAARISAVDPSADYANGRGALVFKTSNGGTLSEHVRIDENGNVGIGISAPSEALDVAGTIQSSHYIIAGKGSGGVALTDNDGQGNANVTFNHVDGTPEQSGNSARIVVNTDNSTNASMSFEVRSGVTGGVNIGTTLSFRIYETSVDVIGALSKGSGSFKIPHPILEGTHNLVHSFIEGPRADLIYRGKATLVDGQATVNIDESAGMTEGTFVALNRDIQCWVTNDSGWTAVRGSVSGNVLTIEAQDSACTDSVSWLVIGERHDQHMYDTGWTDDEGRVIVEPEIVVEEAN